MLDAERVLLISVFAVLAGGIGLAMPVSAEESENPRVERAIRAFENAVGQAQQAHSDAVSEADAELNEALVAAQQRAIRDLKRLVSRRSSATELAEIYRQVLSLTRVTRMRAAFLKVSAP